MTTAIGRGFLSSNKEIFYYSVFGQYILTPEVFFELDTIISSNHRLGNNREFGMTDAFSALIDKGGIFGAVLNGKMFDIGNAEMYRNAIQNY